MQVSVLGGELASVDDLDGGVAGDQVAYLVGPVVQRRLAVRVHLAVEFAEEVLCHSGCTVQEL
eukprot:SAG31_NODE_2095_length_6455_cov_10.774072_1_plen_62_part_10